MNPVKKIFVKKIELQEGLNDFDLEKIKEEIAVTLVGSGYKLGDEVPEIKYSGYYLFTYWYCVSAVGGRFHSTTGHDQQEED